MDSLKSARPENRLEERASHAPRLAIALGLAFPLVLPWGFVRTGEEIWLLAQQASATEDFWSLYLRVLVAFRWFIIAFGIASVGRLFVAWGAVRAYRATKGPETPTQG